MIFGPATDGYPIVNYEYAIVPTKQPSALGAQAMKAVLAWAIDPSGGSASTYLNQVDFVALPSAVVSHLDQAHRPRSSASVGRAPTGRADAMTATWRTRMIEAEADATPRRPCLRSTAEATRAGRRPSTPGRAPWRSRRVGPAPAAPGGGGGGGRPSRHRATAWWRAERLLPHGLRADGLSAPRRAGRSSWRRWCGRRCRPSATTASASSPARRGTWAAPTARSSPTNGVSHPAGRHLRGAAPHRRARCSPRSSPSCWPCPSAIGTALIVVEKLPPRLSNAVGFCLEVLAGVPSVVFGLWGVFTFGPVPGPRRGPACGQPHARRARPALLPGEGPNSAGSGKGLLTVGRGARHHDPAHHRRHHPRPAAPGAAGHGGRSRRPGHDRRRGARRGHPPWVRAGVIGASRARPGRALGETIAVAMVSGSLTGANVHSLYGALTPSRPPS